MLATLTLTLALVGADPLPALQPVARRLPPPGIEPPAADADSLRTRAAALRERFAKVADHVHAADAEVLLKSVEFALDLGEFYDPRDVGKARWALDLAEQRIAALAAGEAPWTRQSGLVVRGFYSHLDGSPQPYGVEIPADIDLSPTAAPVPLFLWLHGRGDKQTDLHFLHERAHKPGQMRPRGAIVVHPFGRQCLGFKSAGEVDVLEARAAALAGYPIDRDRVVLAGFSMGGAGAWHLGAHYAAEWAAVAPGAGFAETARYINLPANHATPPYERQLWRLYDTPGYVRNLFNTEVVAYSGELDRQIQAARVMEEAFAAQGRQLTHLIGPGVEHKYHPDVLQELTARLERAAERGVNRRPETVHLQTHTLRYARQAWVEALRLDEHWQEARVDARLSGPREITATTRNVAAVRFTPFDGAEAVRVAIDGQTVEASAPSAGGIVLERAGDRWRLATSADDAGKRPGLQGPIDDAFLDRERGVLVVTPSGACAHPAVERWVQFELARFRQRWREAFRGVLREKRDVDVTDADLAEFHIVLWGDPQANRLLARLADKLPLSWSAETLELAGQRYPATGHAAAMIYPNPLAPSRYVVLNSGPTFREDHDRTNSLQNPKLPDWAVIDLSQPPSGSSPGRIAAADFFDEQWRVK